MNVLKSNKIKILLLCFFAPFAKADLVYDFSDPNQSTAGWAVTAPNYARGGEWDDVTHTYTPAGGFTQKEGVSHDTSNGYISQTTTAGPETNFLKLELTAGLLDYMGGNVSISLSDKLAFTSSADAPIIEWMLFTATVNGTAYTLGYELPFRDGEGIQSVNFSLSAENFSLINSIEYYQDIMNPGAAPILTVDAGSKGALGALSFEDFLANCDGIYIRTLRQSMGMVGGEEHFAGTQLYSLSITPNTLIPEPAGLSLLLSGFGFCAFRRRRR